MATLANTYQLIDDYGTSAGPSGGQAGAASGQPIGPPFTAPTLASAAQLAFIVSTAFQRPLRLCPLGSAPPYTLIVGQGANTALTVVPSGIGF